MPLHIVFVVLQSRRRRQITQAMREQTPNGNNGSIGSTFREQDNSTAEASVTAITPSAQDKQALATTAGSSAVKGPLTDVVRTTMLKVPTPCVCCTLSEDVSLARVPKIYRVPRLVRASCSM